MSDPVKRLVRPSHRAWIGGVCAGLGDYFGHDPALFRASFVAAILFGGLGLVLYAALYFLTPSRDTLERQHRPTTGASHLASMGDAPADRQ
jgi:phage shock protein PspC (stress-responsive transcriptional regulator)